MGPSWGHLGALRGLYAGLASRSIVWRSRLGPSWSYLGPSGPHLGRQKLTKSLIFLWFFIIFEGWPSSLQRRLSRLMLDPLGLILDALGVILGSSWAFWGPPWALLGPSLAIFGHLGDMRSSFDARNLDRASRSHVSQVYLKACKGASWAIFGPSWGHLGPRWSHLGPRLGHKSGENARDILQKSLPGGLESHLEGYPSHLGPRALHLDPILS